MASLWLTPLPRQSRKKCGKVRFIARNQRHCHSSNNTTSLFRKRCACMQGSHRVQAFMRAHKLYFAFWFPITVICAVAVFSFVYILTNLPRFPRDGMDALLELPTVIVLAPHLPFVLGFIICVVLHPRRSSMRRSIVIPTVVLTAAATAAVRFIPRKTEPTYNVVFEFVDLQGQPTPELTVRYTLETPQFLHLKDYHPPTPQTASVRDGHLTIPKKRIEQLKLEVEAPAYYYLAVDIGQWVEDVPDYIHKIDFYWRRDKTFGTRDDSMYASINWRPIHDRVLRVVMLRHVDPLQPPYPPYTEEDFRAITHQKGP
jgi:hypothetical protein